jgi:long-chain-fatty-acid---luciferin-component ligase
VELEPGKTGGIAILDALNTAYPGFLLSDDVGEVDDSDCACGRTGQTVRFRRRRQGAELGCCAVSIERYLDSNEVVAECELAEAAGGS